MVLDPLKPIRGLHDSKILDAEQRGALAAQIKSRCVSWAVGGADPFEIDQINIYQASRLAMRRAVEALPVLPDYLLIDAIKIDLPVEQLSLIDGDARCRAIAAASIVAKVHRDACLAQWHEVFPQYNLASNKGYSTPDLLTGSRQQPPSSLDRLSHQRPEGRRDPGWLGWRCRFGRTDAWSFRVSSPIGSAPTLPPTARPTLFAKWHRRVLGFCLDFCL